MNNRYPSSPLKHTDLLYFLHIPKTAGITFYNVVRFYFPDGAFSSNHYEVFMRVPPEERRQYRLIGGHLGYNVKALFGRTPVYITMLRDPVEQVISNYYYAQREENHYFHKRANQKDLIEFMCDPVVLKLWANIQTNYLAEDFDHAALLEIYEQRSDYDFGSADAAYPIIAQKCEPSRLIVAKERLQTMQFVGITEHFDESLQLLFYTFDWPIVDSYPTYNVTDSRPTRKQVPPELMGIMQEYYTLDLELYEFGKQLFWNRYQGMVNSLIEAKHWSAARRSLRLAIREKLKPIQHHVVKEEQPERLPILRKLRHRIAGVRPASV